MRFRRQCGMFPTPLFPWCFSWVRRKKKKKHDNEKKKMTHTAFVGRWRALLLPPSLGRRSDMWNMCALLFQSHEKKKGGGGNTQNWKKKKNRLEIKKRKTCLRDNIEEAGKKKNKGRLWEMYQTMKKKKKKKTPLKQQQQQKEIGIQSFHWKQLPSLFFFFPTLLALLLTRDRLINECGGSSSAWVSGVSCTVKKKK